MVKYYQKVQKALQVVEHSQGQVNQKAVTSKVSVQGELYSMLTLTIDKKAHKTLAAAAARAKAEKPFIKRTEERGVYLVRSANGETFYTVRCNSEDRSVSCSCPANKPCKHIAAVAPYHSFLISQEGAQTLIAPVPAPAPVGPGPDCDRCGKPAFAFDGRRYLCKLCLEELAAQAQVGANEADGNGDGGCPGYGSKRNCCGLEAEPGGYCINCGLDAAGDAADVLGVF